MIIMISRITANNIQAHHIHYIKNGSPHTNKSGKLWRKVEKVMKRHALTYSVHETEYEGHARLLTEEILASTKAETFIVVIGGDGTMHEVMNGAAKCKHAVIMCLPAGSGNDYVRGIQHTSGIREAVSLLLQQKAPSVIDLGQFKYQGRMGHFVNSLGIGFDASIAKAVNGSKWKKRFQTLRLGKFVYMYYFIKKLFLFKTFRLKAVVDGRKYICQNVWFVIVANQPYFGGGIKVSPYSSADDGKLQVVVVSNLSSFLFLLVFLTVAWGGHLRLKWVESFTCRAVRLYTSDEVPIQADGEHIGYSAASVKGIPKAVRIIKQSL